MQTTFADTQSATSLSLSSASILSNQSVDLHFHRRLTLSLHSQPSFLPLLMHSIDWAIGLSLLHLPFFQGNKASD